MLDCLEEKRKKNGWDAVVGGRWWVFFEKTSCDGVQLLFEIILQPFTLEIVQKVVRTLSNDFKNFRLSGVGAHKLGLSEPLQWTSTHNIPFLSMQH